MPAISVYLRDEWRDGSPERLFIFRYGKSRQPERESLQQHEAEHAEGNRSFNMPGTGNRADQEMYSHLKHLVPAMAYVPCQEFAPTFELKKALQVGTIFPELCKPFCGRRGGRR